VKTKYDLAISLGGSCGLSQALRRERRQFASFPFDWLGRSTFRRRIELIVSDFDDFLTDTDLYTAPSPEGVWMEHHYTCKNGFVFAHDFDQDKPIPPQIPGVREKYLRRLRHMDGLIEKSHRVLIAWSDLKGHSPDVTDEDIEFAKASFAKKWPQVQFDYVFFRYDKTLPYAKRKTEVRDNVTIVTFDVRDDQPHDTFMLHIPSFQKWFRANIRVPDYRTPQEKREWDAKERRRKFEQYYAKSYWEMVVNRWEIKIYKHLKKALQKKGVI